ncbi:hypothetical protein GCM10027184_53570 [Saccharothrix stipae]
MSPDQALEGFLRALAVPAERISPDSESLTSCFRASVASRKSLIILDNARSTAQVLPLTPGSPTSTAVVISRDRLSGLVARPGACRGQAERRGARGEVVGQCSRCERMIGGCCDVG